MPCFLGKSSAFAEKPSASDTPNSDSTKFKFSIEIGNAYRTFGDVTFKTGSYSKPSDLPQLVPPSGVAAPYGPATGFADRTYGDGFVFRDINTQDPASFLPGTTAFWGYQNNSQVQGGNCTQGEERWHPRTRLAGLTPRQTAQLARLAKEEFRDG